MLKWLQIKKKLKNIKCYKVLINCNAIELLCVAVYAMNYYLILKSCIDPSQLKIVDCVCEGSASISGR